MKRFYDRHVRARRHFVVAAAGNLEPRASCARLLESHMDTGQRLPPAADPGAPDGWRRAPKPSGDDAGEARGPPSRRTSASGRTATRGSDPERFAFGVVNSALGGGMSSRLFQEIREKRGLAYSVYSYHSMFAETGLFCAVRGDHAVERARRSWPSSSGQIDAIAEGGLTEEELDRAKGHMKGSLVLSLEDTGGRMSRIGKSEISHGEILSVDEVAGADRRGDSDEASQAARRGVRPPHGADRGRPVRSRMRSTRSMPMAGRGRSPGRTAAPVALGAGARA